MHLTSLAQISRRLARAFAALTIVAWLVCGWAAFADAQGAPALADLALATRAKAPPVPGVNADLVATLAERKRASRPG